MKTAHSLKCLILALGVIATLAGCGGSGKSGESPTLVVYSASGLSAWYEAQFEKFTAETGVKVTLFEAGSGELVSRLNSGAVWERLNNDGKSVPPADLLVTLPPFIQKAQKAGLLQPSGAETTGIPADLVGPEGSYVPIVKTALCFIVNPEVTPKPVSWQDLTAPRFKGKLQYSTPGETGDGTAVLLLLQHLMGRQGALEYLTKLQPNNVGPASSTASLQPKVSAGELAVANGDVQMNMASINNDGSKFDIFFPAMPDGTRTTVSLPYVAGVTAAARMPEDAKKLLTMLLSEPAQKDAESTAFGIPVRRTDNPKVLDGVRLWTPDWNTVLTELEADLEAYKNVVG